MGNYCSCVEPADDDLRPTTFPPTPRTGTAWQATAAGATGRMARGFRHYRPR